MPSYVPPPGNDVIFDFTVAGYTPPVGNDVIFDFPNPPSADDDVLVMAIY